MAGRCPSLQAQCIRFRVQPGDVTLAKAARRLHLTPEMFKVRLPALLRRGFPQADPDTGMYDLEEIDRWRAARHAASLTAVAASGDVSAEPGLGDKFVRPRSGSGVVELPRYVKRQSKPNGTLFYYYEKFRGTLRAWPRVPLPADTGAPDFWVRCRQCESLQAVRDLAGVWQWSWAAETGRTYSLPSPRTVGMAGFWQAVDDAVEREHRSSSNDNKTFRALVAEFKESKAWDKLSAGSSAADYERYLSVILDAWGDEPVRCLRTQDAQAAIDTYRHAPASGRYFRAVLSRLVAFGVPRGFATTNVVEHSEKPDHESVPYEPWPDWAFELFFAHARIALHLPVFSAVFTGQRKSDVIPMLRPRRDAVSVELIARKTKAKVWVPIQSEYRHIIAASPGDHVRLHLREDGAPWTYEGYKTAWQRDLAFKAENAVTPEQLAKAAAMARLREAGLVFHGLRKNAVNMLLEVGCTEAEVSSIVEMSEAMVRHYSKDVNKRRLAVNGIRKLEAVWSEMRHTVFGASARNVT